MREAKGKVVAELGLAMALGALFIAIALLSRRDLLPRDDRAEGIFDNGYAAWPLGLAIILFGVVTFLGQRGWEGAGAGLAILAAFGLGAYGIFAIVTSPRWLWPQWRHEMEARQQRDAEGKASRP